MEVIKGRMYDYNNGRFLSVDPFIQAPTSTQSMNPYTYIFNNPLSGVDPTGYLVVGPNDTWDDILGGGRSRNPCGNNACFGGDNGKDKGGASSKEQSTVALEGITVIGSSKNLDSNSGRPFFNHTKSARKGVFDAFGLEGGMRLFNRSFYSSDLNDVVDIDVYREAWFHDMYGENGDYWRAKSVGYSGLLSFSAKGQQLGSTIARVRFASSSENVIKSINPNSIRLSQSSVNGAGEITNSMKSSGWVGAPIDVVRLSDGGLTTLDNTRVLAASRAGIDVKAVIRNASDPLPSDLVKRFTTKKGIPNTWGDAVKLRIGNQSAGYRKNNPNGSFVTGTRD